MMIYPHFPLVHHQRDRMQVRNYVGNFQCVANIKLFTSHIINFSITTQNFRTSLYYVLFRQRSSKFSDLRYT